MIRSMRHPGLLVFGIILLSIVTSAQTPSSSTATSSVPHTIKFSGVLQGATGVVGVTFSLYKDQEGGAPLWLEVQNVQADKGGHYTAYLGTNHVDGVPPELFTSGEALWLGVTPEGNSELPRVMLASVPYALKAADAETLGGLPLSAFMLNSAPGIDTVQRNTFTKLAAASDTGATSMAANNFSFSGTKNQLAKFTDDFLGDSMISDTGTGIGIGTTSPESILQIGGNSSQYVKFNPQPWGLRIGSLQSGTQFIGMGVRKHTANNVYVARTNDAATVSHAVMEFRYDGSLVYRQQPHVADDTVLLNLQTAFVVSGAGNVGVGVDTPAAKLEVAGNLKLSGNPGEVGIVFPDNTVQTTAQLVGPQGETGPAGPQGIQGIQGPQGIQGGPGLVTHGAWSSAVSDYALNDVVTSAGSTFRCTVATCTPANDPSTNSPAEWEVLASKGDKGDTGATGPEGPQGIQGPQGDQGPIGLTGDPGPQGPKGDQGDTGSQGAPGLIARGTWSAGVSDYVLNDVVSWSGSAFRCAAPTCTVANDPSVNSPVEWQVLAAKGDKGDTGDTGAQGSQGIQGPQGVQGPQGIQGSQGPIGARGIPGPQGDPGVAQIQALAGAITGTVAGGQSDWIAIGPASTLVTTASQRITGLAVAGLGLDVADTPQSVGVGLCYRPNTGGTLNNFVSSNYTEYVVTPTRSSFLAAGSVVPGAGTWDVSMCVLNGGAATLSDVDYVNGWMMITNEPN